MEEKTENEEVIVSFKKETSRKKKDTGNVTVVIIICGLLLFVAVAMIANKKLMHPMVDYTDTQQLLDQIWSQQQDLIKQNNEILEEQKRLAEKEETLEKGFEQLSKEQKEKEEEITSINNRNMIESLMTADQISTTNNNYLEISNSIEKAQQEEAQIEQSFKQKEEPKFLFTANKAIHQKKTHKKKHHRLIQQAVHLDDLQTIVKPDVDKKKYKYLEMENQLKVLLISDQETKQSQAALSVHAGSWNEPEEYPGLAHFLEHMLFQGSHTFPKTGHFDGLVARGGGYTNAYTQSEMTNYYFEIQNSLFEEALQVFSHFFIDPLLSKDMVEKEANAVNSEYEIDVSGDGWKLMHLMTLLSNPDHPLSRFTIGNLDSLIKEDICHQLKTFFQDHYSSNLMALVVKSSLSLEEMEKYILSSDFSKIPNHNYDKPNFLQFDFPIKPEHLGSIIKYKVNSHARTALFAYQIEDSSKYYKSKPMEMIDSVIKSKHDHGLYHYLLQKNLAIELDADTFLEGNGAFTFYLIQVLLTEKSDILSIGQAITAYFNEMLDKFFIEERGGEIQPSSFLKQLYEEKKALGDISFRFMDDTQEAFNIFHISHNLNTYPPSEVFSADYLIQEFDYKIIYNYITDLLNPGNLMILVGSDEYIYNGVEEQAAKQVVSQEEKDSNSLSSSFIAYLDEPIQFVFAQVAERNDYSFLLDGSLKKRSKLFRIDYDVKKMTPRTLDFITEGISSELVDFQPVEDPKDQKQLKQLSRLRLPKINHYIPKDLKMKSLCEKTYINSHKGKKHNHKILINTDNPFKHLPKTESSQNLEQNEIYQKRMNSFLEYKNRFVFETKADCIKYENEYEHYNVFPQLVKKDLEGRSWWKLDRSFGVPMVYAGLKFDTAVDMKSLKQETLLKVFNEYLNDLFQEKLQQSFEAGFKIGFDSSMRGMSLEFYGWSDKFNGFYSDVLNLMKTPIGNDDKRLDRVKQGLELSIQNTYEKRLYQQAISTYLPMLLQSHYFTPEEQLQELDQLTIEDLSYFSSSMMKNFRFTSFFFGNILRDEADDIMSQIKQTFQESTTHIQWDNHLIVVAGLQGRSVNVAFKSKANDPKDLNGMTLNYYQIGHRDQKQFTIMNLLQSTLHNQAYNYLRTQLQLGYVVSAKFKPVACIDGLAILVQGTAKPPNEVNKHIEEFLKEFGTFLERLQETEFSEIKKGSVNILSKLKDSMKSLEEKGSFMWEHIKFGDLAFEEKEIAASLLDQITKQDVIEFYDKILKSHETAKLSVQIYGEAMIKETMKMNDISEWEEYLKEHTLTKDDTFAGRDEMYVFSRDQFRTRIVKNYYCNYRISNI